MSTTVPPIGTIVVCPVCQGTGGLATTTTTSLEAPCPVCEGQKLLRVLPAWRELPPPAKPRVEKDTP